MVLLYSVFHPSLSQHSWWVIASRRHPLTNNTHINRNQKKQGRIRNLSHPSIVIDNTYHHRRNCRSVLHNRTLSIYRFFSVDWCPSGIQTFSHKIYVARKTCTSYSGGASQSSHWVVPEFSPFPAFQQAAGVITLLGGSSVSTEKRHVSWLKGFELFPWFLFVSTEWWLRG